MRVEGYAVESICTMQREQGLQVAARTYRAWKKGLPALRTIEDARITNTLRSLGVPDAKGGPRPEIIYGGAENDAVAAPERVPGNLKAHRGPVHARRGNERRDQRPQDSHHHPRQDDRRAGDLLNRGFTAPAPNRIWVSDFTYDPVYSGSVYVALVIDLHSRAIVGWEASTVKDTAFVERCLRMALWPRERTG